MKIGTYFIFVCLAIQFWESSQFEFTPEQRQNFYRGIANAEKAYKIYGVDFKLLQIIENEKEAHRAKKHEEDQKKHQDFLKFIDFLKNKAPLLHDEFIKEYVKKFVVLV